MKQKTVSQRQKLWAGLIVLSMVLQFFMPLGTVLQPISVSAEGTALTAEPQRHELNESRARQASGIADFSRDSKPSSRLTDPGSRQDETSAAHGSLDVASHTFELDTSQSNILRQVNASLRFNYTAGEGDVLSILLKEDIGLTSFSDLVLQRVNPETGNTTVTNLDKFALNGQTLQLDLQGLESGEYLLKYDLVENFYQGNEYIPATVTFNDTPVQTANTNSIVGNTESPTISFSSKTVTVENSEITPTNDLEVSRHDVVLNYKVKFYLANDIATSADFSRVFLVDAFNITSDQHEQFFELIDGSISATVFNKDGAPVSDNDHQVFLAGPDMNVSNEYYFGTLRQSMISQNLIKDKDIVAFLKPKGLFHTHGIYKDHTVVLEYSVKLKDSLQMNDFGGLSAYSIKNVSDIYRGRVSWRPALFDRFLENGFPARIGNSFEAEVHFPPKKAPVFDKSIHALGLDEQAVIAEGANAHLALESLEDRFVYHLELDFPRDLFFYKDFFFEDTFNKIHSINPEQVELYLVDPETEVLVTDPDTGEPVTVAVLGADAPSDAVGFKLNHDPENNKLTFTGQNLNKSERLPGKRLVVQIKTKLNLTEGNIGDYYVEDERKILIPNFAERRLEGRLGRSKTTTLLEVPMPGFELRKCGMTEDNVLQFDSLLSGAQFTLTDKTDSNVAVRTIREAEGQTGVYVFDRLVPGHQYEISEIKAPAGYRSNPQSILLSVNHQGVVEVTEGAEQDGEAYYFGNKPRKSLTLQKYIYKGEGAPEPFELPGEASHRTPEDALHLDASTQTIAYRFEVPMPDTTEGIESITVTDALPAGLAFDLSGDKPALVVGYRGSDSGTSEDFTELKLENYQFSFDQAGRSVRISRAENGDVMDALKDKILVIQILVKNHDDLKTLMDLHNGEQVIGATAKLQVNGGDEATADAVYFKFTRGSLTARKMLQPDGTDEPINAKPNSGATFHLIRLEGNQEQVVRRNLMPDDEGYIRADYLEPGRYCFREVTPPGGYTGVTGNIPAGGIEIPKTGEGDTLFVEKALEDPIINTAAEGYHVRKRVGPRFERPAGNETHDDAALNNSASYKMKELREYVTYAVTAYLPLEQLRGRVNNNTLNDIYVIDIAKVVTDLMEMTNRTFHKGTIKSDPNISPDDPEVYDYEAAPADSGMIGLVADDGTLQWKIPKEIIESEYNRIVQLNTDPEIQQNFVVFQMLFDARIKENTYFQRPGLEGYLDGNSLPNVVYLYDGLPVKESDDTYPDPMDQSTASIIPLTFRDVTFKKVTGDFKPLQSVTFSLYKKKEDTSLLQEPADFTTASKPVTGDVVFENVPAGTYLMKESTIPGSYFILPDYYEVTVPEDRSKAVQIRFWKGGDPIEPKVIVNNRRVILSGQKKWLENGNLPDQRPEQITVYLKRFVKGNHGEIEVGFDGAAPRKTISAPNYRYSFGFDDNLVLPEFDANGNRYIYRVFEETNDESVYKFVSPEDDYSVINNLILYDITNELVTTSLRLRKVDGDGTPTGIAGVQLNLQRLNSEVADQEKVTGKDGFVTFDNLPPGSYLLRETLGDPETAAVYIELPVEMYFDITPEGEIMNVSPRLHKKQDEQGVFYKIFNYKQPELVKHMRAAKDGDEAYTEKCLLENYDEPVRYRIQTQFDNLRDVQSITIEDTLPLLMSVTPSSPELYYLDGNAKVVFDAPVDLEIINRQVTLRYEIDRFFTARKNGQVVEGAFDNMAGKTFYFEFEASFKNVNSEVFLAEHGPEGTFANTARMILNHNANNVKESPAAIGMVDFASVRFDKALRPRPEGSTPDLNGFIFQLSEIVDGVPIIRQTINSPEQLQREGDRKNIVAFDHLDTGRYIIEETLAPPGYVRMTPIEFEIRPSDAVDEAPEVYRKDPQSGDYTTLIENGDFGSVINELPEAPILHKLVTDNTPQDFINPEASYDEVKIYNMASRDEEVYFHLRVDMPDSVEGIQSLELRDTLPVALELIEKNANNGKYQYWIYVTKKGTRPETADDIKFQQDEPIESGDTVQLVVDGQTIDNPFQHSVGTGDNGADMFDWSTTDSATLEYLRGQSLHIFFKARLRERYWDDTETAGLTDDGYLVNRMVQRLNGYVIQPDSQDMRPVAFLKPSNLLAVTFEKVARGPKKSTGEGRDYYPAYNAAFKLIDLSDSSATDISMTSNMNGLFNTGQIISVPLDKPSVRYKLIEMDEPKGYIENGEPREAQFRHVFDYFILEVAREEKAVGATEPRDYIYTYQLTGYIDPEGPEGTAYAAETLPEGVTATPIHWENEEGTSQNGVDFIIPNDILIELYVDKIWYDKDNELRMRPSEVLLDVVQYVEGQPEVKKIMHDVVVPRGNFPARFYTGRKVYTKWEEFKPGEDVPPAGFETSVLPIYKYNEQGERYIYYFQEKVPDGYIATNQENQYPDGSFYPIYTHELSGDGDFYEAKIYNKMQSQVILVKKVDQDGALIEAPASFHLEFRAKGSDGVDLVTTRELTTGYPDGQTLEGEPRPDAPGTITIDYLAPNRRYGFAEVESPKDYEGDGTYYVIITDETGAPFANIGENASGEGFEKGPGVFKVYDYSEPHDPNSAVPDGAEPIPFVPISLEEADQPVIWDSVEGNALLREVKDQEQVVRYELVLKNQRLVAPQLQKRIFDDRVTAGDAYVSEYHLQNSDEILKYNVQISELKATGIESMMFIDWVSSPQTGASPPLQLVTREGQPLTIGEDGLIDPELAVAAGYSFDVDGKELLTDPGSKLEYKKINLFMDSNDSDPVQVDAIVFTLSDPRIFAESNARTASMTYYAKYVGPEPGTAEAPQQIENTVRLVVNETDPAKKPAEGNSSSSTATVYIGDPAPQPEPVKQVRDGDHYIGGEKADEGFEATEYSMLSPRETLYYRIKLPIGDNVLGYRTFNITDEIDPALSFGQLDDVYLLDAEQNKESLLSLSSGPDAVLTIITPTAESRKLQVIFSDEFDYTKLYNKVIVIDYTARLNREHLEDNLSDYQEGNAFKVPNKAQLVLNGNENNPAPSNIVDILPPSEASIQKRVKVQGDPDDQAVEKLTGVKKAALDAGFTYIVEAVIPYNLGGIEKFVIKDELPAAFRLNDSDVRVSLDTGAQASDLFETAVTPNGEGYVVTAEPKAEINLEDLRGRVVTLYISVSLNPEKNPADSLNEDGEILNTADLQVTEDSTSTLESNPAILRPETYSIRVIKQLDGQSPWPDDAKRLTALFDLERRVERAGENGGPVTYDWLAVHSMGMTYSGNEADILGLLPGHYRLNEVKLPDGYLANEKHYEFEITNSDLVNGDSIVIDNAKLPEARKSVDKEGIQNPDETITYTLEVPLPNLAPISHFRLEDKISDHFEIREVRVMDQNVAVTDYVNGTNFVLEKPHAELSELLGEATTLTVTITVKLKDGITCDSLSDVERREGIANTAKITINRNAVTESNTVYTKLVVGDLVFTKQVDDTADKTLPDGTAATFDLYRIVDPNDSSKDEKVNAQPVASNRGPDGSDKVTFRNLFPGAYYVQEVTAPLGYVLDSEKKYFVTLTADENGVVTATGGENFSDLTILNVKSTIPKPSKTVNDSSEYTFTTSDAEATVKISVPVTKVDGWSTFELEDELPAQLVPVENSLQINGLAEDPLLPGQTDDYALTADDNLVRFVYKGDLGQALLGKTVVMTFKVKINDLAEFLKAHPRGVAENIATLNVGNATVASEPATLVAPVQQPLITKMLDGKAEDKALGSRNQTFVYDIRVLFPSNLDTYPGLEITDQLASILQVDKASDVRIYVNDQPDASLETYLALDSNNKLTFKIPTEKVEDLKRLEGKTLRLEIRARLKADADPAAAIVAGDSQVLLDDDKQYKIQNTATVKVTGQPEFDSTTAPAVHVLLPGDEPTIEKYFKTQGADKPVEHHLSAVDDSFTYVIDIAAGDSVGGYRELHVLDELPEVLALAGDVTARYGPGDTDTLSVSADSETGLIELKLEKTDNENPFPKLAGKTLRLEIPVKLKEPTEDGLHEIARRYGDSRIPNKATLTFNGTQKESGTVHVIPKASAPRLYKTANAYGEDEALTSLGKTTDEFRYNIEFKIPFNVNGIEKIEVNDPINEKLTVLENGVRVFVDNVDRTATFNGYLNTDNPLALMLDATDTETPFDFAAYAGKTIRLEITVQAKPRALETTDFTEGLVNTAELVFNGTSADTAKATVKFPLGTVILTKSVEGQPLSRGQTSDFILYDAETREPITLRAAQVANNTGFGTDSKTLTVNEDGRIEINSLDVGKYYFKESKAPAGFELDGSEHPFEISVVSPQVTLDVDNRALSSEISVRKSWLDAAGNPMSGELPAIPETLTVQLERRIAGADGDFAPVGDPVTLTAEQGWTYSWAAEPVVNHAGEAYEYRVVETVPENFTPEEPEGKTTAQTTLTDENSFVKTLAFSLTNKYEIPQLATLKATKQWVNGKSEDHGEVALKLYRTVEGAAPTEADLVNKTPTADNDGQGLWTYTWTGLEQTDAQGRRYTYVVREVKNTETGEIYANDEVTDKNYVVTYDDATRTVTNTYRAPTLDVIAEKTWQGGPETKPEIELQLYQNDSKYGPTKTLQGDADPAKLTWSDLPKTDNAGKAYRYSIQEVRVGDMAVVDMTVDLDGTQTEISKAGEYEVTQPETQTAGDNEDELVFNVTNKYVAGQVNVQAIKFWEGGPAEKPTITLQLKRNGEDYGEPVQLDNGTTTHTWTVDRTDAQGNSYSYTVAEIRIGGQDVSEAPYRVSTETTGLTTTITNTYQSPTQTLQAKKVWVNGDAAKPAVYAKLQLLDNGEPVDLTAEKLGLASLPETLVNPQQLPADGTTVSWPDLPVNDRNGRPLRYTVSEVNEDGTPWQHERYTSSVAFDAQAKLFTLTNTYTAATDTVTLIKKWENGPEAKPHIRVRLERKLKHENDEAYAAVEEQPAVTLTPDNLAADGSGNWTYSWSDLPLTDEHNVGYDYRVAEIRIGGQDISDAPYGVSTETTGLTTTITNTYQPPQDTVQATKQWVNGPATKPETWLKLYRKAGEAGTLEAVEGAAVQQVLSGEDTETTVEWTGIDTHDSAGVPYIFSVKEVNADGTDEAFVPENYQKNEAGLTVTNTYRSPTDTVRATLTWVNGPTPRPDVYFELYRTAGEGTPEKVAGAERKLLPDGTTAAEWPNQPITDDSGIAYEYSVKQVDAAGNDLTPEGYEKTENGLEITNTYRPSVTTIQAVKVWEGGGRVDPKPAVFATLQRVDGGEIRFAGEAPQQVTQPMVGDRAVTWTVYTTETDGTPIRYTVTESQTADGEPWDNARWQNNVAVSGDGTVFTLTNTYVAPTTEISMTKQWSGGDKTQRPNLTILLTRRIGAEGTAETVATLVLSKQSATAINTEADTWTYTWTQLPATDSDGNPYTYAVEEIRIGDADVAGNAAGDYTVTYSDDRLTVTNTYQSPTAPVEATLRWVGGESAGTRPTVHFQLYRKTATGTEEAVDDRVAFPDGKTHHAFGAQPTRDPATGEAYTYYVRQVDDAGNDLTPEGYVKEEDGLTVTNTYQVGTTTFTVRKAWVGGDAANRPAVTFELWRSLTAGTRDEKVETVVLDASAETHTFTDLDRTDGAGNVYHYTVVEVNVPQGYSAGYGPIEGTGTESQPFVVTNTYAAEEIEITAKKVWKGGPKPADIYVTLAREDGVAVNNATQKLTTEAVAWRVPATSDNGQPLRYFVEETDVNGNPAVPGGYERTINSLDGRNFTITNTFTRQASLEVLKTDDNARPLKDAYFRLIKTDTEDGNYMMFAHTDAAGRGTFRDIPDGTYALDEFRSPFGYREITGTLATVTVAYGEVTEVTAEDASSVSWANNILTVQNTAERGFITVRKQDAAGNPLTGGYTLFAKHDMTGLSQTYTAEPGTADLEIGLRPGTYFLEETAAPAGYNALPAKIKVEVAEDMSVRINGIPGNVLNLTNYTDAELIAVKTDDNPNRHQGLGGAVFRLEQLAETTSGQRDITITLTADGVDPSLADGTVTVQLSSGDESPQQAMLNARDGYTVRFTELENDSYTLALALDETAAIATGYVFTWGEPTVTGDSATVELILRALPEDTGNSGDATASAETAAVRAELTAAHTMQRSLSELQAAEAAKTAADSALRERIAELDPNSTGREPAELTEDDWHALRALEAAEAPAEGDTAETIDDLRESLALAAADHADKAAVYADLLPAPQEGEPDTRITTASVLDAATIESRLAALAQAIADLEAEITALQDTPNPIATTHDSVTVGFGPGTPMEEAWTLLRDGLTSDQLGVIELDDLGTGTYRLIETAAPTGYATPQGEAAVQRFEIAQDAEGNRVFRIGDQTLPHLVIENTPDDQTDRALHLTKKWYNLQKQTIDWPKDYTLEFIVLKDGVPFPLEPEMAPGLTVQDGRLLVGWQDLAKQTDGAGETYYAAQLRVPEFDGQGDRVTYSMVEVIHEPADIDHPYFWFPENAKVTEDVTSTIHYDNLDPYKLVELVIDVEWLANALGQHGEIPSELNFKVEGRLEGYADVDHVLTLTGGDWHESIWVPYDVENSLTSRHYTYTVTLLDPPAGFEQVYKRDYTQEVDLETGEPKVEWSEGNLKLQWVFEYGFRPPVLPDTPDTPDEPEPETTDPPVVPPPVTPVLPPVGPEAAPSGPREETKLYGIKAPAADGTVTTQVPATGETRTVYPFIALLAIAALLVVRRGKRRED